MFLPQMFKNTLELKETILGLKITNTSSTELWRFVMLK
jgi:hypothetical protein